MKMRTLAVKIQQPLPDALIHVIPSRNVLPPGKSNNVLDVRGRGTCMIFQDGIALYVALGSGMTFCN